MPANSGNLSGEGCLWMANSGLTHGSEIPYLSKRMNGAEPGLHTRLGA